MVSEETLVGKQLDQYEVKAALGRGPVGAVYRAYQPSVNRMVAVKVLPAAFVDVLGFSSAFQQEARAIARLDHPHIVPLYGIGQAEGRPYLVMRYMPGGTLAGMVERYGSLAVSELVPIMEQAGAALDAIQRQGIVHGDLKPSNILLDEEGNAYLSDFGIPSVRKAVQEALKDRQPGPDAAYRAPEIGPGRPPTPAGDMYSLGMIAFYALCGKLPSDLTLLEGASDRLDRETVPSLHGVRSSVPEAVDEIVARALSRDPKARYTSAGEFARALRQAAGHRPPAPGVSPDSTDVLKPVVPVPDRTTPPPLPSPPSLKAIDDTGSRDRKPDSGSRPASTPALKSRPIPRRRRREPRRAPAPRSTSWYTVVLVMLLFVVVWFSFGVVLGIGARSRLNDVHLAAIHGTQTLAAVTSNVESTQTIAAYLGLDATATQQAIAQAAAATAAAPTATPTATLTPTPTPTGTPTPLAGGRGLIAYVSDQDGNPEIYVRDPVTGVASRITRDSGADDNPAWSADGQWLAFQSDVPAPGQHILAVNVADCLRETNGCPQLIRQVTAGTAIDSYPLWSADGQQIAYSSHDGPRFWIRTTTLDGPPRDVTQLPSDSRLYDWSPVDLSFTFFGARPGFAGVFEMLRLPFGGTSSDRTLVTDAAGAIEFLNYSPDRQLVVYEALVGNRRMLFLADGTCAHIDDCVIQQLTNDQFNYLTPRFSPDGTLIITASDRSGHMNLYAMDLQGNITQRLTSDPWSETNGAWQP